MRKKLSAIIIASLLLELATFGQVSAAGTPSKTMVRFDRMATSSATTGTVCIAPTGTTAIQSVAVTFPTGYATSTTLTNWTVTTTNLAWPSGGTALTGVGTATSVSAATAGIVVFPIAPALTTVAATLYCFNWSNSAAVTLPAVTATPGGSVSTYTTNNGTGSAVDTGNYTTAVISSDQVTVSATVAETFSFALANTTDTLGTLSSSGTTSSPTPATATISTNAKNGWQTWAKDSNTGLHSTVASKTIASTTPGTNSTLSGGTEGYNTGVTSSQVGGAGTITIDTAFVGGSAGRGGGLDTTLRTLAASNGTANQSQLTLTNNVTISNITPAASDYTDTITIIAAGLF